MMHPHEHKHYLTSPQLAYVKKSQQGIASELSDNGTSIPVYAQASHINALRNNDEVVFFHTVQGAFIIARALKHGEQPAYHLEQSDENTISMHFGKAHLEIKNSGEIKIIGKDLLQKTENDICLEGGRHIHLNSF